MFDRNLVVLLLLATFSAHAEDWIVLRPHGAGNLPAILIDTSSIVVRDSGLRQATTKLDWLNPADGEAPAANALKIMLFLETYDCAKGLKLTERYIPTLGDGKPQPPVELRNAKWSPRDKESGG